MNTSSSSCLRVKVMLCYRCLSHRPSLLIFTRTPCPSRLATLYAFKKRKLVLSNKYISQLSSSTSSVAVQLRWYPSLGETQSPSRNKRLVSLKNLSILKSIHLAININQCPGLAWKAYDIQLASHEQRSFNWKMTGRRRMRWRQDLNWSTIRRKRRKVDPVIS